ncbi:hypothetical protein H6F78_05515 [Coleofasciculus sp. FACHB-64]|uniref:hypothetical protein n=1 Tax=Cyanophyceae TaxID=3028117 RepID=UPI0016855C72|nr:MULTISPECIES: hypothetical protein [unclassified Coleofasciculus]MBD1840345.1 hypothetical protein [Coleofasciculus sp. FACHB-501]MBD1893550.1 hypothetical protein [Coleofasciculus sp. FACHB-129]MBD2045061.1 hypothetical protein [Coleofasciculus sp. FACHB-64]MBD2541825.1 hypothetical protein [Coleofasciculus sp. FACHB-SPT36]
MQFFISPKKARKFLIFAVIGFIFASLASQLTRHFLYQQGYKLLWLNKVVELFNVDREKNFPALFSASLLLLCSILLAVITYAKKTESDRYTFHWGALSVLFLFLSADEWLSFHEKTIEPLRDTFKATGFLYYTWVIFGIAFVFLTLIFFLKFLVHLPAKIRRLFLIAGTFFVGGSIGMELVSGFYVYHYGRLIWGATSTKQTIQAIGYMLMSSLEECLEMVGVVLFIYAVMSYMSSYVKEVQIRIEEETPTVPLMKYPEKV